MEEPQEIEEPQPDGGGVNYVGHTCQTLSPAVVTHLAKVMHETDLLNGMEAGALRAVLREVISGSCSYSPEALVRLCREAHEKRDRRTLNLAAEALVKIATPLLLFQARSLLPEDRRDHAQEILLQLTAEICDGKSTWAERFFAAYARRRSISLFRKRRARIEGAHHRVEPTKDTDPLIDIPSPVLSHEARLWASRAISQLPAKLKAPFIQYHLLDLTQEEIASRHKVDVRTVRNWLKKAAIAVGMTGEDHD